MNIPKVFIKSRAEFRILNGYMWVFSNEIERVDAGIEKGAVVDLCASNKKFIARGFYNPHSLISARVLTWREEEINEAFFLGRIQRADSFRKNLYPQDSSYRLIFGESDFLPGLIIDRYDRTYVIQSNCLGMDRLLGLAVHALKKLYFPQCIIKKNDSQLRDLEGLAPEVVALDGLFDPEVPAEQEFDGKKVRFLFDPLQGQKTGFFFDQRENRERLKYYARGKSVLDCFSYTGGFGLYAALSGARDVTSVDSSKSACSLQQRNFELNGLQSSILCEDVEDVLGRFQKENRKFDIIALDPPALAKSKKNLFAAARKYRNLNSLALSLLNEGGIFFSSSCSYHLSRTEFVEMLCEAGQRQKKAVKLLEMRGASRDHPVLVSMPETNYLKCAITKAESYV